MPRVSRRTERDHATRLERKHEKLRMLRACIQEWEEYPNLDQAYLKELYRKAEHLENQLKVMAI